MRLVSCRRTADHPPPATRRAVSMPCGCQSPRERRWIGSGGERATRLSIDLSHGPVERTFAPSDRLYGVAGRFSFVRARVCGLLGLCPALLITGLGRYCPGDGHWPYRQESWPAPPARPDSVPGGETESDRRTELDRPFGWPSAASERRLRLAGPLSSPWMFSGRRWRLASAVAPSASRDASPVGLRCWTGDIRPGQGGRSWGGGDRRPVSTPGDQG